jgi:hypothetical protein
MKKIDIFYGLIIGLIGSYLFIIVFTPYSFLGGLQLLKFEGKIGKVITLGTILNIGMLFILLKNKKELMAKGIILAVLLLTIFNLFI